MDGSKNGSGGCVLFIIIAVGALIFFGLRAVVENRQHRKVLELYGEDTLELCVNPEGWLSGSGEAGERFLFLSTESDVNRVNPVNSYMRLLDKDQQPL